MNTEREMTLQEWVGRLKARADLAAERERELVEMVRALKPNQASSNSEVCLWRDEGWNALQKALAKIDAQENSDDN